jgi:hypothetical protein
VIEVPGHADQRQRDPEPAAWPAGGPDRRTSTPGKNCGGGAVPPLEASVPDTTATPLPGSRESSRKVASEAHAQPSTLSAGPANVDPDMAPAGRDVVSWGNGTAT